MRPFVRALARSLANASTFLLPPPDRKVIRQRPLERGTGGLAVVPVIYAIRGPARAGTVVGDRQVRVEIKKREWSL